MEAFDAYGYLLLFINETNTQMGLARSLLVSRQTELVPLLAGSLFLLYLVVYLTYIVHKPRIVSSNGKLVDVLTKNCSTLQRKYWPTFWAPQRHLQTVLRVLLQTSPKVHQRSRRELITFSDGGQAFLDWCGEEGGTSGDASCPPVVIILPGITGSVRENYVLHVVEDALDCGWEPVVFNYRGLGGAKLATPRLDCLGDCSDLREVVRHVRAKRPTAELALLGMSMGGVQIVNYLALCGESGEDPLVKCGLVISVPWRLDVSRAEMRRDLLNRWIVGSYVAWKVRRVLSRNKDVFLEAERKGQSTIEYSKASKVQTYEELCEHITCPMFGFKTCEDYLSFASPHLKLPHVRTPLFCLNSQDDVYCPRHAIPEKLILENSSVALVLTKCGGHIGFMEGISPFGKTWMHQFIKECLSFMSDDSNQLL